MLSTTRLGYPYDYGDKKQTSYEIENGKKVNYIIQLVKKTTNLFKKIFTKTYKITEVISKNGIIEKVKIIFVTFVFVLGLRSGSLNTSEIPTPLFISSEVYQSSVMKSDNLRLLNYPPGIPDFILKLKGGSDELSIEEQKQLIDSILAKTPESDLDDISINKFLQRLFEIIDPVISNRKLWRILSELEKPFKPELSDGNPISPTDILGTAQNKQSKSKSASSIFAEALNTPNTRKLSPMQKRVQLKMAKKYFSSSLDSSGLSRNHDRLSKNIQSIEKLTKLRRSEPLYPSEVLGDSFEYGRKQLVRKAPRHLPDFGISIVGKTPEQLAVEYKDLVETTFSKQGLVVRKDGTLNKQKPPINMGDPETLAIVAFENNQLYDKHRFISSYPISKEAFDHFVETGEIGLSPEEKKAQMDAFQKKQAQEERERANERSFYGSLPEDARIGNQQLREVEGIKERLKEDPNFPLTEKEKNLIQRRENYRRYKDTFYQNNPEIDRDEL